MPRQSSSSIPTEIVPAGTGTRRQLLIGPDVGPNFALRKFIMEPGGGMPLHTNTVEHEQYVLRGRARVVIGDDVLEVVKDDVVFIPGGVPHSYEALGAEPFEFLCVVPNLRDESRIIETSPVASPGGTDELSDLEVPEDELGC
ncbi:MAG: cupin domain-containing protein [Gemmatimonadota bacterium]